MSQSNTSKRTDGIYHAPDVQVEPFPALANSMMGGITAPIHPPHRFNVETLMYVAVRVEETSRESKENKPSSKLKSKIQSFSIALSKSSSRSASSENIRVIRIPRSDYIKYFARNEAGEYAGTEPEQSWNDEDLEEAFGRYRDCQPTKWVRTEPEQGSSALVPGKEGFVPAEGCEKGDGSRLLHEVQH